MLMSLQEQLNINENNYIPARNTINIEAMRNITEKYQCPSMIDSTQGNFMKDPTKNKTAAIKPDNQRDHLQQTESLF